MRTNVRLLTPAFAALSLAFAATGSNAADIFSLTSTTFEDGKLMPKKVANSKANQPNNPNCAITWSKTMRIMSSSHSKRSEKRLIGPRKTAPPLTLPAFGI